MKDKLGIKLNQTFLKYAKKACPFKTILEIYLPLSGPQLVYSCIFWVPIGTLPTDVENGGALAERLTSKRQSIEDLRIQMVYL